MVMRGLSGALNWVTITTRGASFSGSELFQFGTKLEMSVCTFGVLLERAAPRRIVMGAHDVTEALSYLRCHHDA